ncbi:MAG: hypothetical protein M1318_08790, partial [Firmicutes bacterium]|nr:hypothetical protein [Bacillota bacterium]
PNLLAPVIRPGSVEVRFVPPTTLPGHALYEIEIEGRNPVTAVGPDLGEKYMTYTRFNNVLISNGSAELTSLAGKLYWVRVRVVLGKGHKVLSQWSNPLPFTALPGPLPQGVS